MTVGLRSGSAFGICVRTSRFICTYMKFSPGPVPQWHSRPSIDVLSREWLVQKRVRDKMDLSTRQVIRGAGVGIDQSLPCEERVGAGIRPRLTVELSTSGM